MAELVTTGNGEVERIADRADLRLSYSGRGRDRTAAVNELTKRIGTVEPLLERDGVQVRSRRLSVHDVWDGRRRSGAAAEQSYQLRITDVTVLDDLIAALVTTEPSGIDGPFWDQADQTEPAREAQRSAVA
ncbi:MAG TPA: SIMPL domain-containing protein, partial [Pseudonocardiaceae bacterium]|nr:SIMPL domain-containing protein [Pseudonocardiaceae bacterium]